MSNTINETAVEELKVFLDENNILLRDVRYCGYEEKYFNYEVKNLEDDYDINHEVDVLEWIPVKYNDAFTMLNKEFDVVNTADDIKFATEYITELE